jgi:hypothetical protein
MDKIKEKYNDATIDNDKLKLEQKNRDLDKNIERIKKSNKTYSNILSILNDIENFKKYENYEDWYDKEKNKSELINKMIMCSNKFTNIIFNVFKSKGPVLIYSNYVLIEGIDVLKIYLKLLKANKKFQILCI